MLWTETPMALTARRMTMLTIDASMAYSITLAPDRSAASRLAWREKDGNVTIFSRVVPV
jgi:hypothetical protein